MTAYTKNDLIRDIQNVIPFDTKEEKDVHTLVQFLTHDDNPFVRSNLSGHITASAWIVSPDYTQTLLTHHAVLDKWLQCGGHVDGEICARTAAMREAWEESGIEGITPVYDAIFDIDIRPIPNNPAKKEPEHLHYDIRYLFRAPTMDFTISNESKDLQWVSLDDLLSMDIQHSMRRMAQKWKIGLDNGFTRDTSL